MSDALKDLIEAVEAENVALRVALSDLVSCTELATGECDWPEGQDPLSRARRAAEEA